MLVEWGSTNVFLELICSIGFFKKKLVQAHTLLFNSIIDQSIDRWLVCFLKSVCIKAVCRCYLLELPRAYVSGFRMIRNNVSFYWKIPLFINWLEDIDSVCGRRIRCKNKKANSNYNQSELCPEGQSKLSWHLVPPLSLYRKPWWNHKSFGPISNFFVK